MFTLSMCLFTGLVSFDFGYIFLCRAAYNYAESNASNFATDQI